MTHLLDIESLSVDTILSLVRASDSFVEISERDLKKVPALRGKTVVSLFMEPSTRTRTSFEIAGKRLSADVINISSSTSSTTKGETLLDTARTIEAMRPDVLVLRHKESGAPHFLQRYLTKTSIINAGDGLHEHPTQALLDLLTVYRHRRKLGLQIQGLKVAIVGDVRHSRVARSTIWTHLKLGNSVTLVGPSTLVPVQMAASFGPGELAVSHSLREGIEGADVIVCLRMQLEREAGSFIPSLDEYSRHYCLGAEIVSGCAPNSVVLHPGPINRGIEISSELADSARSLIASQVTHGVAVRMATLFRAVTGKVSEAAHPTEGV